MVIQLPPDPPCQRFWTFQTVLKTLYRPQSVRGFLFLVVPNHILIAKSFREQ